MNIEEARKVLWLKTNPRPLGELLDEGILTIENLEWAAKWAYAEKLKEAAKVILEADSKFTGSYIENIKEVTETEKKQAEIEVGISLDKARSTIWPFRDLKGQTMGKLVDSKQLSLKDLGYAVENAQDLRVKQAAIALSLVKLKQALKEPVPSAGFINVISSGRSYAQRRETYFTLLQGALLGFATTLALSVLFSSFRNSANSNPEAITLREFVSQPYGISALLIVASTFVLIGWLFNFALEKINKKLDKEIEVHRLGQEGEDNVVQRISQTLDGNWHLFRNISIPGQNKADLDIVLVGPPGIWALEVKNFRGSYRNIGETWEYQRGKDWKPVSKSPSRQAYNSSLRLANFLKADHFKTFVNPVVVWANSTSPLEIENPSVEVWHYNWLSNELGNVWQREKLAKAERDKIIEKLTKLCEKQKSEHLG